TVTDNVADLRRFLDDIVRNPPEGFAPGAAVEEAVETGLARREVSGMQPVSPQQAVVLEKTPGIRERRSFGLLGGRNTALYDLPDGTYLAVLREEGVSANPVAAVRVETESAIEALSDMAIAQNEDVAFYASRAFRAMNAERVAISPSEKFQWRAVRYRAESQFVKSEMTVHRSHTLEDLISRGVVKHPTPAWQRELDRLNALRDSVLRSTGRRHDKELELLRVELGLSKKEASSIRGEVRGSMDILEAPPEPGRPVVETRRLDIPELREVPLKESNFLKSLSRSEMDELADLGRKGRRLSTQQERRLDDLQMRSDRVDRVRREFGERAVRGEKGPGDIIIEGGTQQELGPGTFAPGPEAEGVVFKKPTAIGRIPTTGGRRILSWEEIEAGLNPGEDMVSGIRRLRGYDAMTPDELVREELRIAAAAPKGAVEAGAPEAIAARRSNVELQAVRDAAKEAGGRPGQAVGDFPSPGMPPPVKP
ncbi:hypothetical protein LCGC14_2554940, partial [marine sediment metagenome]